MFKVTVHVPIEDYLAKHTDHEGHADFVTRLETGFINAWLTALDMAARLDAAEAEVAELKRDRVRMLAEHVVLADTAAERIAELQEEVFWRRETAAHDLSATLRMNDRLVAARARIRELETRGEGDCEVRREIELARRAA